MLERLAQWCVRRRRIVVVGWVVGLIVLSILGSSYAGKFSNNAHPPNTESQQAFDLLRQRFPAHAGFDGTVVFKADKGVNDPTVRQRMEALFAAVQGMPHVVGVDSPYAAQGARQISRDGRIAYADIRFTDLTNKQAADVAPKMRDLAEAANAPGLQVDLGGQIFGSFKPPSSEGIGILAAVLILLLAFGSVLAMGLPIGTALVGIGCGLAVVKLLAHVMPVPDFAVQVAAMLGIGVGIDYALFIVTRYRTGLHDGLAPDSSIVVSMTTAGRAVLFAGCTVVISLLGMLLMGVSFVRGLAIGASLAVLLTMAATLTLLPALLGFAGRKIDWLSVFHLPGLRRRHERAESDPRQTFWYRWSRIVQHRPRSALAVGLVILGVMALPVFALRLGSSDAGNSPTSDTTRRAYDLLSTGFGPGFNGPLLLAAEMQGPQDMPVLVRLSQELQRTPGVAFVTPPQPNPAGDTAVLQVFPTTSPQDQQTTRLIHDIRKHVVPPAVAGTDVKVKVGGMTASFNDFADLLGARLPLFIAAVLGLSFLLLLVVFRSVLVPLKAVVMNLLSIGAAYGMLVAIFQWGWLKDVVGIGKGGPIESWAPMMLFAIVFGLSMDYEVFLLSRMREEYERTHDNTTAVADGLTTTARVITAAALIMVCVFGSFVLGDQRVLKLIGLGLAFAVLVDATLVRMLLVPATMELLGDRNWWFPRWLDRAVPHVAIDVPDRVPDLGGELEPELVR